MMDMFDRQRLRQYRSSCNKVGWFILLYIGFMYLCVSMEEILEYLVAYMSVPGEQGDIISSFLSSSNIGGWGYLLMSVGVVIMLMIWKKPKFTFVTAWEPGSQMHISDFIVLLVMFTGVQGISQLVLGQAEAILNIFGLSILEGYSMVGAGDDTLPSFIYGSVLAPIVEELMFRGVVMRQLRPMGKKFAIVVSAVLFGLFHGNLVQIPFAILVGLILGYVAMEYSLGWAVFLHLFNNMFLADSITRVLPTSAANIVCVILFYGCMALGIFFLILRRKEFKFFRRSNQNDPLAMRSLISAPGIIVFLVYVLYSVVRTTLILVVPIS